ncbi:hypothetical protein YTPLAS18_16190 [Nitrospira sp.]|nr:hypothetical protein YTPLAS18_16190 [Nitrospira sp.]
MTRLGFTNLGVAALFGFLGGWVATAFLGLSAVTAQVGERYPVTTTGITIVTEEGQPRASLTLWDNQHPALIFADDKCERRAALTVAPMERAGLTLYGEDCKRRVALELQADDLPSLVLRDTEDVPRARLHLLKDGSPVFALYDPTGKRLQTFPD